MADICPTAWLFRKPLIQIQHPGPKLKLGKKKKSTNKKETHDDYIHMVKPSDVEIIMYTNKCLQRKKEERQKNNLS